MFGYDLWSSQELTNQSQKVIHQNREYSKANEIKESNKGNNKKEKGYLLWLADFPRRLFICISFLLREVLYHVHHLRFQSRKLMPSLHIHVDVELIKGFCRYVLHNNNVRWGRGCDESNGEWKNKQEQGRVNEERKRGDEEGKELTITWWDLSPFERLYNKRCILISFTPTRLSTCPLPPHPTRSCSHTSLGTSFFGASGYLGWTWEISFLPCVALSLLSFLSSLAFWFLLSCWWV